MKSLRRFFESDIHEYLKIVQSMNFQKIILKKNSLTEQNNYLCQNLKIIHKMFNSLALSKPLSQTILFSTF